jgi:hypothetical protein
VAKNSAKQQAERHQSAACGTIAQNLAISIFEIPAVRIGVQRTLQASWAKVGFDVPVVSWLTTHFQDFSVNFRA